ncbi:MAG: glycoside hydrolase family 78 protein [Clostridia bacterium]|nr:glycoside hydrolase family 78 protein [Clostridia bacterium]
MNIYDLNINRTGVNIGLSPENMMFSFKSVKGEQFKLSLFQNDENVKTYSLTLDDSICFYPDYTFEYGTKYKVVVENEFGDSTELAFRTAEKEIGNWLVTDKKCPIFKKVFDASCEYTEASLTISALGLYVAYLNGERIGDVYLAPGMNDYDDYVRFQTYSLTNLKEKDNVLEVWVGDGWYKGRFGIDGHGDSTWGSDYCLNAKISFYGKEKTEIITDDSWKVSEGYVLETSIYDGEIRNDNKELSFENAIIKDKSFRLIPDITAGIKCYETRKGSLIITPKNETVIDFGQNASGIVSFVNNLKKGQKIKISYGEILQDGCFYRDNLRSAKAVFEYESDGVEKNVEALFCYYGFRYIKVESDATVDAKDFTAILISTSLKPTLTFKTNNEKLNRLCENVRYGQLSNFLDVPTDCPQRDERLGWTADTQVFTKTACYQSEAYSFYKKYVLDLLYDQKVYYNGDFPMYSPSLKGSTGPGGAVWADAGVIVPWEVYNSFGDKKLLYEHYFGVKTYVDKLIGGDKERNDNHLLSQPFTFGDWLAQDGICTQSLRGGTDDTYIRSAYYYYVVDLCAKMGKILGKEDYQCYEKLAYEIKESIKKEYFTPSGRLALDTQASYVVALRFGLYDDKDKMIALFKDKLRRDLYRIKCGFVGGPLMVKTMFDFGMEEEAARVLFNEKYPGWLFEVNLGATTIWERWNSVDETGHITGIFMNSLNHYAYGSVAEAIYSYVGGLSQIDVAWRKARIAPSISSFVKESNLVYSSPYGDHICSYKLDGNNIHMEITVPHGTTAIVSLPLSDKDEFEVSEGTYTYDYKLSKDVSHPYSEYTKMCDLMLNKEAADLLRECLPQTYFMVNGENEEFMVLCLADMVWLPMYGVTQEGYAKFQSKIKEIQA